MFSFRLRADDADLEWRQTPTGFARGSSYIAPLRHPALEEISFVEGKRAVICVREKPAGTPAPNMPVLRADAVIDQVAETLRSWPLQWHMLLANGATVELEAGHWGTAPIFLVANREVLYGDWDAHNLLPLVRKNTLNPGRAARWLMYYETPYSTHTLFDDLQMLPERWKARWNSSRDGLSDIVFEAPASWPRPYAGTLRDGTNPIKALGDIIDASLRRWAFADDDGFACEVSGGLDSCMVTAVANQQSAMPRRSYGLTVLGSPQAQRDQRERRTEIVERFNLRDTAIDMAQFLPLAPESGRLNGRLPTMPWEEGYYEAMDELLERARADGTRVLATGFGGDELFGLRPSERRSVTGRSTFDTDNADTRFGPDFLTSMSKDAVRAEQMPRSSSSESAVEAAAFSAARYLRHGIWPIHPLCTPELVHYCARLPVPWRRDRHIERAYLSRRGLTPRVTHPNFRDDFSPSMERSMRTIARPVLDRLFRTPALADLGIVDGTRLRHEYSEWCGNGITASATVFYATAILELALQKSR